jgi:hypothetical protein
MPDRRCACRSTFLWWPRPAPARTAAARNWTRLGPWRAGGEPDATGRGTLEFGKSGRSTGALLPCTCGRATTRPSTAPSRRTAASAPARRTSMAMWRCDDLVGLVRLLVAKSQPARRPGRADLPGSVRLGACAAWLMACAATRATAAGATSPRTTISATISSACSCRPDLMYSSGHWFASRTTTLEAASYPQTRPRLPQARAQAGLTIA